jgi:2-C-methyl-D-erythritol 4-phosphate cytidylyltransferase
MISAAILLAAGSGTRFGGNKLIQDLGGKPVWRWSFDAFVRHPGVHSVIVVCSTQILEQIHAEIHDRADVILGGETRQASTLAGIWKASKTNADTVLVHDCARPFVSQQTISEVLSCAQAGTPCAPYVPPTDTIKRISGGMVSEHLDRVTLGAFQTPQAAPLAQLVDATSKISGEATDELQILGAAGYACAAIPGEAVNRKITHPDDLEWARQIVAHELWGE